MIRPLLQFVALVFLVMVHDTALCSVSQRGHANASQSFAEGQALRQRWQKQALEEAIKKFAKARTAYRAVANAEMEAKSLSAIADVLSVLARYSDAIGYHTAALQLYRKTQNREGEAKSFNGIALVHLSQGQYQPAIRYSNQALTLSKELANKSIQSDALSNLAEAYYYLADFNEATKVLDQLASITTETDLQNQARINSTRGVIYTDQGQHEKAFELMNRGVLLFRQVNDRQGEAGTLGLLGSQYAFVGEFQKSLDYLNEALSIFREIGDRKGEADQVVKIGYTYLCLGEFDNAVTYYSQGAGIYRELLNHYREGTTLGDLGDVQLMLGNAIAALENYQRALKLVVAAGDKQWEAFVLEALGRTYSEQRNRTLALDSFNKAFKLFHQLGNQRWQANTLAGIAGEYIAMKDFTRARSAVEQALTLSRSAGDLNGESKALYYSSRIDSQLGNFEKAKAQIESVIRINETLRSKILSQQSRSSYLATVHRYYESYIDLLMRMHKQNPGAAYDRKAFEASERGRARSLVEMMMESGTDIRHGVNPQLLAKEKALEQQLNDLMQQEILLLTNSGNKIATASQNLQTEIQILTSQLQQVQANIRAASVQYAALPPTSAITAQEVQRMLDPDTALIEFSLGTDSSYVWVISDSSVNGFQLPPRQDIEKLARNVYETFAVADPDKVVTTANKVHANSDNEAASLRQLLLGSAEPLLAQKKRLMIVADGFLQHISFGMLPQRTVSATGTRRLIEDYEVGSLPAASVLALQRREFADRPVSSSDVAVFADPVFDESDARTLAPGSRPLRTRSRSNEAPSSPLLRAVRSVGFDKPGRSIPRLPFSRDEAAAIAAAAGPHSVQALDFKASLQTLRTTDLSKYRYIHFATHGLLNSEHPELSGIVLSLVNEKGQRVDGFLQLQEIYNLKLSADLVVLSACQTALGKDVNGEGLIGLTRGFMYAGAKSVVGSLWKVDDSATAALMGVFYKEMLTNGKRPAAALRTAQIRISNEKRWRSPYYWAGFVLQGEWR